MKIGKNSVNDEDVVIDLKNLIATRLLIQANSGGGKSWLLRRLLEQSHGKVQQIVLDLEGEFATLREHYDYLLVGKEGEVPANIKTAALLARKLLELNVSTIIDLSELKKHERILFVKRFLDSLVDSPKNLWHPCLIVVDEAHEFCPQGRALQKIAALVAIGRKEEDIKMPEKKVFTLTPRVFVPRPIAQDVIQATPKSIPGIPSIPDTLDGEINLSLCEKEIYTLLCQHPDKAFSKPQIAIFTGRSFRSSGFVNSLSRLNILGLIMRNGKLIQVKEIDDSLIGEFDFSKEATISKLSKCEKEIYNVLFDDPNNSFSKEELAESTASNYSVRTSGFVSAISRLNVMELLKRDNGLISLNPEMLEIVR